MNFLKNRTVIGVICIMLSLVICFGVTPFFNQGISQKIKIVRVIQEIKIGDEITPEMVKTVEVGGYNLPEDVVKNTEAILGKFASKDMVPGDYIISSKIADEPAAENAYLYSLNGEKQALSVSVKSFATGLSGKLISGDIVSIIAPDFKMQGVTLIPPELAFVEVIAVTAGSGYDANTSEQSKEAEEKELPSTVTLLVTPEQGKILAMLEAEGKLHLALVYRGDQASAAEFIATQKAVLVELYPQAKKPETVIDENAANVEVSTLPTKTLKESGDQ